VKRQLSPGGLLPRFQAVIAAGDYARGKPHPDPFLAAAERLGVKPEDCLALEDSHNGVRAAHAAGMMTIMVPDLLEATEEMQSLCITVTETLHEVRELLARPDQRQ
jgi:beta-phosphoglucomutase-like phosphatase (HAD superfamily)